MGWVLCVVAPLTLKQICLFVESSVRYLGSVLFFLFVVIIMGMSVGLLGYNFSVRYQPVIQRWSRVKVQEINSLLQEKYSPRFSSSSITIMEDIDGENTDTNTFLPERMPSNNI